MTGADGSEDSNNKQFKLISLIDGNNNHNGYLKYLRLHECNILPFNYKKDNFLARYLANGTKSDEIMSDKMRHLERLDLAVRTSLDKQMLHTLLGSFDSLQILNMEVTMSESREAWDDDFPFSALKHLHELRIKVRRELASLGFVPNNSGNTVEFGVYLGKSLSQLKSLRVFELEDFPSGKMRLNIFFGLLIPCSQLTQLEKLIISVFTEQENDAYDNYDIMPEAYNEVVRQRRKILEDLLYDSVENIKAFNLNLEIMSLEGFHLYGKNNIWYEKNGKTKEDFQSEGSRLAQDIRLSLLLNEQLF